MSSKPSPSPVARPPPEEKKSVLPPHPSTCRCSSCANNRLPGLRPGYCGVSTGAPPFVSGPTNPRVPVRPSTPLLPPTTVLSRPPTPSSSITETEYEQAQEHWDLRLVYNQQVHPAGDSFDCVCSDLEEAIEEAIEDASSLHKSSSIVSSDEEDSIYGS